MKNILLTGATGFVGRQVLFHLLNKRFKIHLIIRKGREKIIKYKSSKIKLIFTKDLFKENQNWWKKKCKDIDTIIHLAWYTKHEDYQNSPKNIDCLIGSINLVKGAIEAGVRRFVGIGTCFEYEFSSKDLTVNTPLKPLTIYAGTKAGLYLTLSKLLPLKSIEFSWCRLFYLYGEGENERRLFPYLHNQLSKGKVAQLTNGNQIRDFLDVRKAGKMIVNVSIGMQQGPVNICSGNPKTVRQLAEKIADKYNRRDLLKFGKRLNNLIDPPRVVGLSNLKPMKKTIK